MEKRMLVFLLLLAAVVFHASCIASAEEPSFVQESIFVFPSSLQEIADEAFEGTAVRTVVFQNGLLQIGDHAFADTPCLTDAYIPASTEYIAESAFGGNEGLTIHGEEDSYPQQWAEEHHIAFTVANIWKPIPVKENKAGVQEMEVHFFITVHPDQTVRSAFGATDEDESKRPQDRPELNPIDYRFP